MYSSGCLVQYRQQPHYPKPKRNIENKRCDVCNITARGQDQLESHLMGAKHAKKVKEQENTKKMEEVPHLRFDYNYGVYECTICHVSLNSSSVAVFHVMGNRHQGAVKSVETEKATETMPDSTEMSNGDSACVGTDQVDQPSNHQNVAPPLKPRIPSLFEVRPNFNVNSNYTNMTPPVGPMFRFQCKSLASSFVSKYTRHTVEAVSAAVNSAPRPRWKPNSGPRAFPCLACNIVTNSELQLQAHLSSEKHRNRLGPGSGPIVRQPNFPRPPAIMSALRCESCNISVNSQIQLDQHLQSPKHRYRLKMRYEPY